MAKRPTLAVASGTPAASAQNGTMAELEGMGKADLERLLGAISQKLKNTA